MAYFKMKLRMLSKSLGTYLIPSIFLFLGIVLITLFSILINKNSLYIAQINKQTEIIFGITMGLLFVSIFILIAYLIYLIELIYHDDKKNGIDVLMYSKPVSKRNIYFSNYFAIMIPVLICMFAIWFLSLIFLSSIHINKANMGKIALTLFIVPLLFLMVFSTFGYLVSAKLSFKVLPIVMVSPLILGATSPLISLIDHNKNRNLYNAVTRSINSKQQIPLTFNKGNIDINQFSKIYDENSKLKNNVLTFDMKAKNNLNFWEIESIYKIKQDDKIVSPYFNWISWYKHVQNITSHLLNTSASFDSLNEYDYYAKVSKGSIDYSKYDTFTLKNKSGDIKKYLLFQTSLYDKQSPLYFDEYKKDILTSLLNMRKLFKNNQFAMDEINKANYFLRNLNSIEDIYRSKEFNDLISKAYAKINELNLDKFDGNFNKIYEEIYKEANKFIEYDTNKPDGKITNIINSVMFNTHNLSLYLLAKYYVNNKDKLKYIDIISVNKVNSSTDEEKKMLNKFSKILSKDDNNSYEVEKIKSLLNYAFTEANEHTLKRISVKKYIPPSLSFVLPLILFSLFLGLGYLVHKRRNFK